MCRDAPCARAHACVCARACVWCVHSTLDGGTRAEPVASRARELSVGAGRLGGLAHVAENVVASEWALLLMVAMRSQCSWQTAAPRARLHKRDAACACARRHAEQDDQRDWGGGGGAHRRLGNARLQRLKFTRDGCDGRLASGSTQARERAALMRQCGVCVCACGGGGGGGRRRCIAAMRPPMDSCCEFGHVLVGGRGNVFSFFSRDVMRRGSPHARLRAAALRPPWPVASRKPRPLPARSLVVAGCAGTWAVCGKLKMPAC